jgi:hypothetical protein
VSRCPPGQRPESGAFGIPREHAITRLYVLPAGSASAFMAELQDDTEEPTSELRVLLDDEGI